MHSHFGRQTCEVSPPIQCNSNLLLGIGDGRWETSLAIVVAGVEVANGVRLTPKARVRWVEPCDVEFAPLGKFLQLARSKEHLLVQMRILFSQCRGN